MTMNSDKRYHVTYYYLATGMEGRADERDYGIVDAPSADEVKNIIAARECKSIHDREWVKGCPSAKQVG